MPSSIHTLSTDTRTASTKGRPPRIYEGLPFVSHAPSRTRDIAGFTLVELLVSVAIFALMTALVVAKYGNFNNSVLLTNLAYEVGGVIRTAQTYGVSVRNTDSSGGDFKSGYGVYFSTSAINSPSSGQPYNQTLTFFADKNNDYLYTNGSPPDTVVSTYTLKRGAVIKGYCIVPAGCNLSMPGTTIETGNLSVTFKRPDPDAHICLDSSCPTYVEILIQAPDGSIRSVTVRSNGQIAVKD